MKPSDVVDDPSNVDGAGVSLSQSATSSVVDATTDSVLAAELAELAALELEFSSKGGAVVVSSV